MHPHGAVDTDGIDLAETNDIEHLAVTAATCLEARGELYEQFADPIYRFVAARVSWDERTAEDLAQEVWVRFVRNIAGYSSGGPGSFAGWLFTIARNIVTDHYRSKGRRHDFLTGDVLELDQASQDESPEEAAEREERAATVRKAVGRLSSKHRECVELRFFHGLSVAETASVMGKTPGAVRVMQHRAAKQLAEHLSPTPAGNPLFGTDVSSGAVKSVQQGAAGAWSTTGGRG